MSGHSKWHSIRHKKGAADAKRGKIFSKLAKAISIAVKEGGPDTGTNFALRLAIEKAKQANMPKDNIERAIARGSGEGGEGQLETAIYDGVAPGGASVVIEAVTDNTNRTFSTIRGIFTKSGGNLDAQVMWQFEQKGVVRVKDASAIKDREAFELALIDAGAEEINWTDEELEIISEKNDLQAVEGAVSSAGLQVESAELEYIPKIRATLSPEAEEALDNFLEKLDDDDDVTNVYTNAA